MGILTLIACSDTTLDLRSSGSPPEALPDTAARADTPPRLAPRPSVAALARGSGPDSAPDSAPDSGADSGADSAPDSRADTSGDTAEPVDWSRPDGCGDDVVEGAEECDGVEDGACPGSCSAACQCPSAAATGLLSLHVIDVGQGDGMLLVSPDGFTMLVDTGQEDEYPGYAGAIRDAGHASLDYALVSHQHADHMGGMDLALEDHPEIGVAWDGGSRASNGGYEDYRSAAGDRHTTLEVGQHLDLGPSIDVDVLHADMGDEEEENNNSVVLRVTYGAIRLLLGGDCESDVCEASFDPGPIDVYKVHHHGAHNASSPAFLRSMAPTLGLISAGGDGYPDDDALEALEEAGAEVWRTDEVGTIRVDIDGLGYSVFAE